MNVFKILALGLVFAVTPVFAQAPAPISALKALTFSAWKDQQVLDAQNLVLRTAARVQQLKTGKGKVQEPSDVPSSSKLKKMDGIESLAMAEQDVKRAQDTLEGANKLQFEDYVEVYIPSLQDQPEALQKLSEKLTKEELTEIFKVLMRKGKDANATRNAALVDSLTVSSRTKTQ